MVETERHRIIQGDCIEVMRGLVSEGIKVDALITDPPYQVANKNTITFKTRKNMSRDFGEWDYFGKSSTTGSIEYQQFMHSFLELSKELLKPCGNLVMFTRLEKISKCVDDYEGLGFKHHGTLIWHKTNPTPRVRKTGFLSACEAIVWATSPGDKALRPTFNFTTQREMHNHFESPICMGKERTKHETQKPRKVIDHLVKLFTSPDDLILDSFAGSGTLAESADVLGRRSINIEKEQRYFDMMCDRLRFKAAVRGLNIIEQGPVAKISIES